MSELSIRRPAADDHRYLLGQHLPGVLWFPVLLNLAECRKLVLRRFLQSQAPSTGGYMLTSCCNSIQLIPAAYRFCSIRFAWRVPIREAKGSMRSSCSESLSLRLRSCWTRAEAPVIDITPLWSRRFFRLVLMPLMMAALEHHLPQAPVRGRWRRRLHSRSLRLAYQYHTQ